MLTVNSSASQSLFNLVFPFLNQDIWYPDVSCWLVKVKVLEWKTAAAAAAAAALSGLYYTNVFTVSEGKSVFDSSAVSRQLCVTWVSLDFPRGRTSAASRVFYCLLHTMTSDVRHQTCPGALWCGPGVRGVKQGHGELDELQVKVQILHNQLKEQFTERNQVFGFFQQMNENIHLWR